MDDDDTLRPLRPPEKGSSERACYDALTWDERELWRAWRREEPGAAERIFRLPEHRRTLVMRALGY